MTEFQSAESDARSIRYLADQAFARSAGAPLTGGNQVELLFDSEQNFPAWLSAVDGATESILIEMYLFSDDAFGRRMRAALIDKARAGVRVCLLYDALGCWREHLWGFFKPLRQAGAEVRAYNPINPLRGLALLGRNHRKLFVVDRRQAFVSGLCISSRWEGDPAKHLSPWRDTGVRLIGPVVEEAVAAFCDSWASCGEALRLPPRSTESEPSPQSPVTVRLIATTPTTAHMMRLDLLIASFARKSLWLTDAYFMGTSLYLSALKQAAQDGVDVRLLVPRSSDIGWIATVSRTLYRPLLEAGVRVFEWNGQMVHAKSAVADGRWARIGSSNLNLSSWLTNRELDVAIEDAEIATAMEVKFIQDLGQATEIVLKGTRRRPALSEPRDIDLAQSVQQLIHPSAAARHASAAARQAARISDALGAVVRGTRPVESSEAASFLSIGLFLLALALLVGFFPYLVAVPLVLVLAISGCGIALRALGLMWQRHQRRHEQDKDLP
ncbi:phospholipase D-like domain-containing protein [Paludibacterium purpuratum]|uniref:Cardiolipin synthase n=1 Tax=Paludibacterium purpuratum TaxID=1144873 RepID=A0A4R7B1A7_9NEIS|nr:phospholipase D-like domain-containing protein [Paludibacterium purpuratum]TDR76709.1 cardiolipin synthase [Paludibacterium purpuratum]